MISIVLRDFDKNNLTTISSFFKMEFIEEMGVGSRLQITLPYDEENIIKLTENNRKTGNTIKISFSREWNEHILFEWIIAKVNLSWKLIEIEALDYIWRTKAREENRKLLSDKTYSNQTVSSIITDLYSIFWSQYDLPFEIWLNNDTTLISISFPSWKTFFDCLTQLYADNKVNWRCQEKLDVWDFGILKAGLWKYDNEDRNWSLIIDFDWEDSIYQLQKNNTQNPYPKIELDTDKIDWWNYKLWDKKSVQIRTSLEWWEIGFVWVVKKISIKALATKLQAKMEISDEFSQEVNSWFDAIMRELHSRE